MKFRVVSEMILKAKIKYAIGNNKTGKVDSMRLQI